MNVNVPQVFNIKDQLAVGVIRFITINMNLFIVEVNLKIRVIDCIAVLDVNG